MSQITYRANLSAASFPLSLSQAGRSVIVPGPDNNYDRRVDPIGEGSDAGIPQAIYLENVIPTTYGYQSVGLFPKDQLPIVGSAGVPVYQVPAKYADIYTGVETTYKVTLVGSTGAIYASNIGRLEDWGVVAFSGTAAYPYYGLSSAIVRGTCYVFIKGLTSELYTAVHAVGVLTLTNITASVLPALFLDDVVEITDAYNYLVAMKDDNTIAWSSTTTPTDFVISLVTGAGVQAPNMAASTLLAIRNYPQGFYIYTKDGVISAEYTGNSRYPWRFIPVADTNGYMSFSDGDRNSSNTFLVEETGAIRVMTGHTSELIAPELSDYLRAQGPVDFYNRTTDTFYTESLGPFPDPPKIQLFYDRYICVSCDKTAGAQYTSIVIYDIILKRYGRIKVDHTHLVFSNTIDNSMNASQIGIINTITEETYIVDFELEASSGGLHTGVLVLGKFQYVRSRFLALDELSIEGKFPVTPVDVRILPTLDGKTFQSALTPTLVAAPNTTLREYACRVEAKNVSVVLKGRFSISCLELVFHPGAGR